MNNALIINKKGQSIWYDNIERSLLQNGTLNQMIEAEEIFGVTSNPSIFKNAITGSSIYDDEIKKLKKEGKSAFEIYDALSIEDIKTTCDLFLNHYKETNGKDGYVSLEVDPRMAYNTDETISEAKRIWNEVNRPNLMVKIPATKEGLGAISAVISEGINVNVTLIFSINRYLEVMDAYLTGLEIALKNGVSINTIHSVASFFISRLDSKIDAKLEKIDNIDKDLFGKIAVANGKLAYKEFNDVFSSNRWKSLEKEGANKQRPLWASTSTKNPEYKDTMYVDDLIAENTVNTVPPKTLALYLDHGKTEISIYNDFDIYMSYFSKLDEFGISLNEATDELEKEGVDSFSDSFEILLEAIELK